MVGKVSVVFHPQLNMDGAEEQEALAQELRDAIHARHDAMSGEISEDGPTLGEEEMYESMASTDEAFFQETQEIDSATKKKTESATSSGRNSAIAFGQFVSS